MTPEFVSQTPQRPQKDTRAQQGMAGRNPDADLHPNIDNEPCSAVGGGQRCGALEHLKWYWQATGNTRQDGKAEFRWVGGHRRDGEGMDVTVNMHKMWKRRNGGGGKPSWTLWPQGAPRPQLPTLTELAAAAGGGLSHVAHPLFMPIEVLACQNICQNTCQNTIRIRGPICLKGNAALVVARRLRDNEAQ